MVSRVPFADVRAYLKRHGWEHFRSYARFRMFQKPNVLLPIQVVVDEHDTVHRDDFARINAIVEETDQDDVESETRTI